MDGIERAEVDSLKRQLARARKDLTLVCLGFSFGGFAMGYLLYWYMRDQPTVVTGMLLAAGCGSVFLGGFLAAVYMCFSRVGEFIRQRSDAERAQQQYFHNSLKQIQK